MLCVYCEAEAVTVYHGNAVCEKHKKEAVDTFNKAMVKYEKYMAKTMERMERTHEPMMKKIEKI